MGISCYLKVDGLNGTAKDPGHIGWIELVSINTSNSAFDAEVSSSLCLTRNCDTLSPVFFDFFRSRQILSTIIIDAVQQNGKTTCMMRYILRQAVISSINSSIYTSSDQVEDVLLNNIYTNNMLEDICFNFKSLTIEHYNTDSAEVSNDKPDDDSQALDEARTPKRFQRES